MKKIILSVFLVLFLFGSGLCFAESSIPNLVGTWTIQAEGAVVSKSDEAGVFTHHSGNFSSINAKLVITKQEGRVFHGTFTSKKMSETFAGVIGMDNKTFYLVDQDGISDGMIIDNDNATCVYRHVSDKDSVVAVATWVREK